MTIELSLMLAGMLVIGFLAQWLAWRVRLPAIVFLLLAGILLGPVSGVLDPDKLLGDLLFPAVSLAVALILFEGSLTLRFHELPGIGKAVRGLVSYGAVATVLLLALAAHLVADLTWPIALLFGALACVTGPTVIAPMLRTLRPNARIANTLRWEGIVIDPLGALFAVLIYEAIVSRQEGHTIGIFVATIACGVGIGALSAWMMAFFLRRQMIPEYLQNYAVLAAVLLAFSVSNALTHESGLLAVTIMGIALGNLRGVHIDDILDFKESLTTLLVSLLFILLAARLHWPLPDGMLGAGIALFVIAQLLVRPVTVAFATFGSGLNWRERALIGWVAPRGIVAASVSALFALRLDALGVAGADALVPLVFTLIIGTVVLQSATARPLALWLKVAEPEPRGVLIFGSDAVARAIGKALEHSAGTDGGAQHVLRQPGFAACRATPGPHGHRPPAGDVHPSRTQLAGLRSLPAGVWSRKGVPVAQPDAEGKHRSCGDRRQSAGAAVVRRNDDPRPLRRDAGAGLANQVDQAQCDLRLAAIHRAVRFEHGADVRC
jgi:NhaP-type Na+/H+ or K+/H+ antiporter